MSGVPTVRGYLRAHGRTSASWTDWYTRVAGALFIAVTLGGVVRTALPSAAREVEPSQAGAGVALIALAYAGFLTLARRFGPVALPAADAAWLVLSPLPRRGVLGRSTTLLLVIALVGGAALGLALFAVVGAADPVRLAAALVLGVAVTAGGTATAVLAQASPPWDAWLQTVIVASAAVAVLAIGPGREPAASAADAPMSLVTATAVAGAAASALLLRLAWGALPRIPARSLLDASTRTGHVATAAAVLDPAALAGIAEDAHWRGRLVRSRPWPGRLRRPAAALAWFDWRRLSRRPGRLCGIAASAALPALVAAAGAGTGGVAVAVGAGAMTAAASSTAGARRDADDPGLARLSGIAPRSALAARAVLPALLGGAWLTLALAGLAATGALPGAAWWAFGPAAAPALAAGALRMARRRPVDHAMPIFDTPLGALPTGPFVWAVTGIDVAALGCAPLLAALGAPTSAIGAQLAAQAVAGAAVLAAYLATARR
ncbi:DUF6297 family protein [Actinomadura algeriensis]|uniref:ABC-2 type transport system permease protein n=1 Tax=Actinomadura algeriensis TaxID=1679523 RepID=A0ABR9JVS9_9ACTN|nr:DUF6297 family protein [Actinomadura algeriensis]MBE1534684.1 hypothetical protein [Actinomadura algeriensis]